MYKTISELNEMEIPEHGLSCTIKGYFFYRIAEDNLGEITLPSCFLSSAEEESTTYVTISSDVGESVISNDETFGMMVGGRYAYYGLAAEVTGFVVRKENRLAFSRVEKLHLEKNDLTQDFIYDN